MCHDKNGRLFNIEHLLPLTGDTSSVAGGAPLRMGTAPSVSQGTGGCSVTGKVPSKEAALEAPLLQPHTGESTGETSAGDVVQGKEAAQRYVTVW